jgi:hypothetical protein
VSRDEIKAEAGRLSRPGSTVRCVDEPNGVVVILEPFTLPVKGVYDQDQVGALAFRVPLEYPDASPDPSGFCIKPALHLKRTHQPPHATGSQPLAGEEWMKFSWAPKGAQWDPDTDSLESHLAMVERRFLRRN